MSKIFRYYEDQYEAMNDKLSTLQLHEIMNMQDISDTIQEISNIIKNCSVGNLQLMRDYEIENDVDNMLETIKQGD